MVYKLSRTSNLWTLFFIFGINLDKYGNLTKYGLENSKKTTHLQLSKESSTGIQNCVYILSLPSIKCFHVRIINRLTNSNLIRINYFYLWRSGKGKYTLYFHDRSKWIHFLVNQGKCDSSLKIHTGLELFTNNIHLYHMMLCFL